jgi:hypothetical protein
VLTAKADFCDTVYGIINNSLPRVLWELLAKLCAGELEPFQFIKSETGSIRLFYSAENWEVLVEASSLFNNPVSLYSCASLFLWIGLPLGSASYEI